MRIVCISDTHDRHDELHIPEGDVLVHAGDATRRGTEEQIRAFAAWMGTMNHPHKIFVAGNHDFGFEQRPAEARRWITDGTGVTYLQDDGVRIAGVHFWGSPWQPWFHDWAFQAQPGPEMAAKWAPIPNDVDVLITHGPPHGIMDRTISGVDAGCEELRKAVLGRIRPAFHVFGHIHECYGELQLDGVRFINAASCNVRYEAANAAIVFEI